MQEVEEFLREKRRKKRPSTVEQYSFVLEKVWLPWCKTVGISQPGQCTDKRMDEFVDSLTSRTVKPLSPATVRTWLRVVRIFLNWCEVPKGRFEAPAEPQRLKQTLSREEIDLMERKTTNERDALIVRMLADTGIRISELLGLRATDLREDAHNHRYLIWVIGKGDRQREVSVPRETFNRLKAHAKKQDGEYLFYELRKRHSARQRLTRNGAYQVIRFLAQEAGIERKIGPHMFRHTFATRQIRAGTDLIILQKHLGHTTLAMLSRVYAHVTSADGYDQLMAGLRG